MKPSTPEELLNDPTQPAPWDADKTFLYFIAAEEDLINKVCDYLDKHNQRKLSASLLRLHQDIGIEIVEGLSEDAPGPESAALLKDAMPVTSDRLALLHEAATLLPDGETRNAFLALNQCLPVLQPVAQSGPTTRRDFG